MDIIKQFTDRMSGKALPGQRRDSKWRKLRKEFLKQFPRCAVCDGIKKIEVHHKVPFNLAPDLELEMDNLVTLCENKKYGLNCHLLIGHLGNYRRINAFVDCDVVVWKMKIGKA